MDQQTGKYILIAGLCILIVGVAIYFFHGYLKWVGRLPGDIRVEKENFRFYFPITTMVILSVILSFIIALFKRLF
ncbi:MAG: DUF2905 domain-containing protein [Ginsengibacter sp.]